MQTIGWIDATEKTDNKTPHYSVRRFIKTSLIYIVNIYCIKDVSVLVENIPTLTRIYYIIKLTFISFILIP